jgi:hypothetical protein
MKHGFGIKVTKKGKKIKVTNEILETDLNQYQVTVKFNHEKGSTEFW